MNRFLTFLLLVVSTVAASAANPTLENFDQTHFRTNNPPPGIIRTRLSSSNFDQSGDTWSITNVSGATGASLWTNNVDGFMRVIPGNAINGIETTNHFIQKLLYQEGAMVWNGVLSSNLVAGLNELTPYEVNSLRLTGSSGTPSDSTVTLSGAHGPGQLLIVENYTEGLGFCITNNTPLWDDPSKSIILPNGNWCPTSEGEQIWLRLNGHGDWVEVLRVITSGPGFAIINPTDTYVPRRIDANTFGDSLLQYRDTNYMTLHGFGAGLFIGSHTETWYGSGLTGEAIVAANIVADGDPDDFEMVLAAVNGSNNGEFHVDGSSAAATASLTVNGASPSQLYLSSRNFYQRLDSGDFHFNMDPFGTVAATAPFYFNQDAVYDGTNVLAQIDYRTNTQFRVNIDSGYTGTGAKWLDDAGNYTVPGTSGITMNPTDGRVPYRFDATTFQDSPWFYHATNIMSFGSGTNQFLYQQDSDTFALGWEAAADRILGNNNVAIGMRSMMSADGQFQSVAVGNFTLQNHGGSDNTAIGHRALMAVNATAATAFGGNNTAIGFVAMDNITNGYNNVAVGAEALQDVGDGRENTGLGYHAGDMFSGVNSIFLGSRSGNHSSQTVLTNVAVLAYNARATNNNEFIIGNPTNYYVFPGTSLIVPGAAGYTGAGTLFLSDDGTYKAAGGPGGSSLWANVAGVLQPIGGQTTNALLFTSGSADAATNTAFTVDTVNVWTDASSKLQQWRHVGTNVAYITPNGSIEIGRSIVDWWAPDETDILAGVHDVAQGESDYSGLHIAAIDDASDPVNWASFTVTANTGATPAIVSTFKASTNAVDSSFEIFLQPEANVARLTLTDKGNTAFAVADNSGYTGAGTLFLSDDGTYKAAGGGAGTAGTVINTGASTVGAVPQYTDTSGTNVAPTTILSGSISKVFNVLNYGILPDGNDHTVALSNLLVTAYAAGGGTIEFNQGTYLFTNQIVFPNDGASPPRQTPFRLTGQGAFFAGQAGVPNGGTILDLRFTGTPAKIDTRGIGLLEIDNLTMMSGGTSGTPFLQTTMTTLHIWTTSFYGKNTGQSADEDAIILGGTTTALDGSADAAFQGYGTVIEKCYFNKIRRGVYLRTYCNGVVIRDNIWWNQCGGTAAIESLGYDAGNVNSGCFIGGNLIEVNTYTNAMKFANTIQFNIIGNNYYDGAAVTTAYIRFDSSAQYNQVIHGFHSDSITAVDDQSAGLVNQIITSHQSQTNRFAQPFLFSSGEVRFKNSSSVGPYIEDTTGNQWFYQSSGTTTLDMKITPAGSTNETIAKFQRSSATDKRISIQATATGYFEGTGDVVLRTGANKILYFGDAAAQPMFLYSGSGTGSYLRGPPGIYLGGTTTNFPYFKQATGLLAIKDGGDSTNMTVSLGGLRTQMTDIKTGAYTVTAWDHTIPCDTSSAGFTITLPSSPGRGQILNIKKVSTDSNTLTISGNGKNIDGSANQTTSLTTRPNFQIQYSGTEWLIL